MVFGQMGVMAGLEFLLQPKGSFLPVNYWEFYKRYSTGIYVKGILMFSMVGGAGITSLRATCDNFKQG